MLMKSALGPTIQGQYLIPADSGLSLGREKQCRLDFTNNTLHFYSMKQVTSKYLLRYQCSGRGRDAHTSLH